MVRRDDLAGATSRRLDRISPPRPGSGTQRAPDGKEALYSTAPTAAPSAHVLVVCERCDVETGLSLLEARRLLAPPFLWNPVRGWMWARCPACGRRGRLRIRQGQALRALLARRG